MLVICPFCAWRTPALPGTVTLCAGCRRPLLAPNGAVVPPSVAPPGGSVTWAPDPRMTQWSPAPVPAPPGAAPVPSAVTVQWRAAPPVGVGLATSDEPAPAPVSPTPSYHGQAPLWGLPMVVRPPKPPRTPEPKTGGLLRAAWMLSLVTAVLSLGSAFAEAWQYLLMLQGRAQVLDPGPVRVNHVLAVVLGWTALFAGALAAAAVMSAVRRVQELVHHRTGRPLRSPTEVGLRFLFPVWNLYGAPQNLIETDRLATSLDPDAAEQRAVPRRLVWWWVCWVSGWAGAVTVGVRRLGSSAQAQADAVLLTAITAVIGTALAVSTVVVMRGLQRRIDARLRWTRWRVEAPAPTRNAAAGTGETVDGKTVTNDGTQPDEATPGTAIPGGAAQDDPARGGDSTEDAESGGGAPLQPTDSDEPEPPADSGAADHRERTVGPAGGDEVASDEATATTAAASGVVDQQEPTVGPAGGDEVASDEATATTAAASGAADQQERTVGPGGGDEVASDEATPASGVVDQQERTVSPGAGGEVATDETAAATESGPAAEDASSTVTRMP